ncbi:hypothetical protein PINS_up012696 [Pythium insidiosum]|nr:hypothetical protein PINS_up012696 [Pythium insidiosum]
MASEMTASFREFALKKINEAKAKGATLATVTAATAAHIKSNVNVAVPAPASFVFRSSQSSATALEKKEVPLEKKIVQLRESNAALKKAATDHPTDTMERGIYKMDLINESLAFTIENLQECSHVMKMMHRQFRDLSAMHSDHEPQFYRRRQPTTPSLSPLPSVEHEGDERTSDAVY